MSLFSRYPGLAVLLAVACGGAAWWGASQLGCPTHIALGWGVVAVWLANVARYIAVASRDWLDAMKKEYAIYGACCGAILVASIWLCVVENGAHQGYFFGLFIMTLAVSALTVPCVVAVTPSLYWVAGYYRREPDCNVYGAVPVSHSEVLRRPCRDITPRPEALPSPKSRRLLC